ncbi:hypothetical protein OIX85_003863 [Vibrio parahaemolyticus]|nr:hypothetical protein [Vibrio parahaemolyticus]
MRIDIGIDPDSIAHGAAIAIDRKLTDLKCMTLFDIVSYINSIPLDADIRFHIEDVSKQKAVFSDKASALRKTRGDMSRKYAEVGRKVGLVQQAQAELVRFLKSMDRPIKIHLYPISSAWKKPEAGKVYMQRVWGYTGRSNEDTRSAAYFLSLGCR